MTCPYCGEEMEKGVLQASGFIGWNVKARLFRTGMFAKMNLGEIVDAYRCDHCKKVVIDYKDMNV